MKLYIWYLSGYLPGSTFSNPSHIYNLYLSKQRARGKQIYLSHILLLFIIKQYVNKSPIDFNSQSHMIMIFDKPMNYEIIISGFSLQMKRVRHGNSFHRMVSGPGTLADLYGSRACFP